MRDRQRSRLYRRRKSRFEASDRYRGAAYYGMEPGEVLELVSTVGYPFVWESC